MGRFGRRRIGVTQQVCDISSMISDILLVRLAICRPFWFSNLWLTLTVARMTIRAHRTGYEP